MVGALGLVLIAAQTQTRELSVFAAASLTESFTAIARTFEGAHPGIHVDLQFAGSQSLATQINQGAPADVFASAAPADLEKVAYDPHTRRIFAVNRLVVVTPATAPKLENVRDLPKLKSLVLAAPAVPAGRYARQALTLAAARYGDAWRAAVLSHVVSEETDVRAVLTKVEFGEADAGIVYATDACAVGQKVSATPIPGVFQPQISYPIAVLRGARSPSLALEFVKAVMSAGGQAELARRGFASLRGRP
jgi:molybdate transport system substrate-binding protein